MILRRRVTLASRQRVGVISFASDSIIKTYGDDLFTNVLTNTGDGVVTYTSSDTSVATVDSSSQVTIVGAGSATITATVADSASYTYPVNSVSFTVVVAKADPVYTAPTANNRTYDTTSKALLVAGSNTTPGTFTYCSTQSGTYSSTIPSQTNAGSYTTYWKFTPTDTNNYNSVGAIAISTTVSAKTVSSPTITLSQSTYTYSGSACQPTPTVKDGSTTISSSEYTVSYSDNVNAGTGTVTITDKSGGNYTVSGSKTFTINKADPTYTAPSATNPTYSGSSQYLHTAGSTSHGTLYYSTNGSNWYTSRRTGTSAGNYTVYYKLTGDSNHNDVASTQISGVTIAQKALTITAKAQSISYGSSIATGTGQVTTSGLVSSDSLTAITLTASTSNVTTSGTITPSAASTTKGANNYSITYTTGNLTITAVPASVTAAPTAKTSLTYSRSAQALVNAGTASGGTMYYKYTTTNSKPTSTSGFSSSIPAITNAGTYYVWYYVKGDSNHNDTAISSTAVAVTIVKATPVVATAPSKRTGLSYTGSAQNLLSGGSMKHSSSDSTSVAGTFTYAQGTNAGTYNSLTWSFAPTDSTNYNSASGTVSGSISIAKASRTLSFPDSYVVLAPSGNITKTATPSAGSGDGAITYSIGSTTYATINSSSGKVTAKTTEGNTTVTATIAEGTNYLSASATYTLYVFATTHNYDYSGSAKSLTLPPGSYKLQLWGAQGAACSDGYGGGKGGYAFGQLTLSNATAVQVRVGGQNGYNGGGTSTGSSTYNSGNENGRSSMGNGGGASDIRLSDGALLSRMIVAGGGSGGAYCEKKVTTQSYETVTTYDNSNFTLEPRAESNGLWTDAGAPWNSAFIDVSGYVGKYALINYPYPYRALVLDHYPAYHEDFASSYISLWIGSTDRRIEILSNYKYIVLLHQAKYATGTVEIQKATSSVDTTTSNSIGHVGGGTTSGGYTIDLQGKQSSAGTGGSFGQGANQSTTNYRYASGAGGGGWYGGGGGQKSNSDITYCKYSGGGSGWVNTSASASNRPSGYTGLQLDSGNTYDGSGTFVAPNGSNENGHSGNGYVRITRL